MVGLVVGDYFFVWCDVEGFQDFGDICVDVQGVSWVYVGGLFEIDCVGYMFGFCGEYFGIGVFVGVVCILYCQVGGVEVVLQVFVGCVGFVV